MKVLWKIVKTIIIIVWVLVAIATTVCLISLNEFGVTEIGKKSVFVIDDDSHEPEFYEDDLIIATKLKEKDYSVGDSVFYYLDNSKDSVLIKSGIIQSIDVLPDGEDTFHFLKKSVTNELDTGNLISFGRIIGKTKEVKSYRKLGLVLNILESKFGFLFLIILPTIFATVYEVYSIIEEVKSNDEKED